MSESVKRAQAYLQWREGSAWRLLAADQAATVIALLQIILYDQERVLSSSVFHERVGRQLEELRFAGFDLPQSVKAYVSQWLTAGFIERSFPKNASEETYELTSGAIQAIQFVEKIVNKRQIATESRLSLVIQQLILLCEQTESNKQQRIATLEKQRHKIDQEILAAKTGNITMLGGERAIERVQEIIVLANELVNDFRQVKDNFYSLNRNFREQLMSDDENRGLVLSEIFAGIDVITESEAGRSFNAFWRLLTNPQQSLELEEATNTLLSRTFLF